MTTLPFTAPASPVQFEVFIPGIPKPQPRPRAFARRVGSSFVARVYDAGTAEGWKGAVAVALKPYLPREPMTLPVSVELMFLMPRPASLMRRKDPDGEMPHTGPSDCDNLAKAVLDAATQLGMWRDDRQVYRLVVTKFYAAKAGRTGCLLRMKAEVAA